MCGIFGWNLNKRPHSRREYKKLMRLGRNLGIYNDERGGHSWGAMVDNNEIYKGLDKIKPYIKEIVSECPRRLLGHTRFATTGSVTEENSHPFDIGTVIGAHNGMVYNHYFLNNHYNRKCQVDSEHIFHHINEGKMPEDINAYGAIEFILKDHQESVYLSKFNGGSLSVVRVPYGIVWSSDSTHLDESLKASGIEGRWYEIQFSHLYEAKIGKLFDTQIKFNFKESYVAPKTNWTDKNWRLNNTDHSSSWGWYEH